MGLVVVSPDPNISEECPLGSSVVIAQFWGALGFACPLSQDHSAHLWEMGLSGNLSTFCFTLASESHYSWMTESCLEPLKKAVEWPGNSCCDGDLFLHISPSFFLQLASLSGLISHGTRGSVTDHGYAVPATSPRLLGSRHLLLSGLAHMLPVSRRWHPFLSELQE